MTYKAPEASERLMLQKSVETVPGAKSVWIPPEAVLADARLLAQLRYDEVAWRRVRSIQAELDQQLYGKNRGLAFVPIGPWHYGPAQLKVEGVPLSTGNFLGLRIIGHTLPENAVHALYERQASNLDEEIGRYPLPLREIKEIPEGESIPTTGEQMADRNTDIYLVKDPAITVLNDPPPITKKAVMKEQSRGTIRVPSEPSDSAAPGEAGGTGKRVGMLRTHTDAVLASHGSVRDLWNGLLDVQKANPKVITSLCWYHSEHKFSKKEIQAYVGLPSPATGNEDDKSREIRTWLNKPSFSGSRGVCIVQVVTQSITGYLFEVQRAVKTEIDGDLPDLGTKISELENFCGLAAIPLKDVDFDIWLNEVLEAISLERAVMSRVLRRITVAHGDDYRRTTKRNDKAAGRATAMNALKKLGVQGLSYPEDKTDAAASA